jgi:spore maturation protein CgeB
VKLLRIVLKGEEHPYYTITSAFKTIFDEVDTLYWDEVNRQDLNGIIQARVRAIPYDAIFMQIQHAGIITRQTAEVLSKYLVFNWTGDVRTDTTWYEEIADCVVTLFTNMTDVKRFRSKGFKSYYLQVGYDHLYYHDKKMSRYGNIAFCGNYYHSAGFPLTEYRAEAVYVLKVNHPERFNLYGSDWDRLVIKSEGHADNEWESLLYNQSLLALNISHFNYENYFSDRLLREMACGCCVLSHRFPCSEFIEKEHIIYFNNTKDLLEKCQYYFDHPEEATEIGQRAAKYVSEKFTWINFAQNLKKLINESNAVSRVAV